jgi:hypothetical protein
MRRLALNSLWFLFALGIGGWSALTQAFSPALPQAARLPLACASGLVLLLSLFRSRLQKPARIATLLIVSVTALIWSRITPSNERNWSPELAKTPYAEINGDTVTIHNVRNFKYRTETDFDPIYENRVVNINDLNEVDMIVVYWGSKAIAHVMVSFGFNNSDYIAFSAETRKEQGESYSTINGFFRNYELTYVVADERDVVALRTTYRQPNEDVYILRTPMALSNGKKLFLNYIETINELYRSPRFYNTLTTNCTTTVLQHVKTFGSAAKYNWKILLSGYVPEYLHDNQSLMPGLTLEEVMQRSHVNPIAQQVPLDSSYSQAIRASIPRPEPRATPLPGYR